ncbi:MAG TPA: CoA ester lyase [Burkholderiales bacterium]|nr:CoA ester lyase [Burkholderiales bacterium]
MLDLRRLRSLLFVPAHIERFVGKAHERGADAVILDLEDSVPAQHKVAARAHAAKAAATLSKHMPVVVRVNSETVAEDIAAVIGPHVGALVLPKVDTAAQAAAAAKHARGTPIIVQVESARALPNLDAIAAVPGVAALNLGAEDFSASIGARPTAEALLLPNQLVLFAAVRAGIVPLAAAISEYGDRDVLRARIRQLRDAGFRGGFCIHPDQVAILNEEFGPSAQEIAHAQAIMKAYEGAVAQGRGAASLDGLMIDAPVVARARAVLEQRR